MKQRTIVISRNAHQIISEIKPSKGWQPLNLGELFRYKDLLYFLTIRGIKARYAQSILGVGWAIIQPLAQTLIFTVIFGNLAQLRSDGVPYLLFSFCAMILWNYFAGILTDSTKSLIENKNVITKVYFPRILYPLSTVLSKLIDFTISFLVFVVLLFFYGITPSVWVFMYPILLLILVSSGLGAGLFLSALAIKFRDVQYAMSFIIRLLMYSVPVVYSVSIIPEKYLLIYALNPMVGVIEASRAIFLNTREVPWHLLSISAITSFLMLCLGLIYFKRMERQFADVA